MRTHVTITCLGDCGSTEVDIRPAMASAQAADYCAILDGSSSFYVMDPRKDPNRLICKCGICGGLIKAEWVNLEDS